MGKTYYILFPVDVNRGPAIEASIIETENYQVFVDEGVAVLIVGKGGPSDIVAEVTTIGSNLREDILMARAEAFAAVPKLLKCIREVREMLIAGAPSSVAASLLEDAYRLCGHTIEGEANGKSKEEDIVGHRALHRPRDGAAGDMLHAIDGKGEVRP